MTIEKITFIGLGIMGYHMAGHLSKHYDVTVYNRTEQKMHSWVKDFKGNACGTIKEAVAGAHVVMTCIGQDSDVEEVYLSANGIADNVSPEAILIDHTTISVDMTKKVDTYLQKNNIAFMDAPVSGGQIGAVNGQLTTMVGGNAETFAKIKPVFAAYCKSSVLMGDVGYGQLAKMVNQICIAGILQGLSEGVRLAKAYDINIPLLVEALKDGAAGSWQLENRATTMAKDAFDFGFAIDWMCKDLDICLKTAESRNITLPFTKDIYHIYKKLQKAGYNRCDTSVLLKQFDL